MRFHKWNRREVITLLGASATGWPFAARAQQAARAARIGLFSGANIPVMARAHRAFVEELRRAGFEEGKNLIIDQRNPDQDMAALAAQATAMVQANVDVLAALGAEPVLRACASASQTTPIVFVANNYDPIALGYVRSLAHPGGNITGVFLRQTELAEKQVELLTQAFANRKRLAVLWDQISAHQFEAAERRAKLLGLQVSSHKMEKPPYDVASAFRSISEAGADLLLLLTSPFFGRHRDELAQLTIRHRLPTMFIFKTYVEAGDLMSYGADSQAMYRQGGTLVAKILKGARPAELPVEQPNTYEMIVNLKTAKAIGVELPTSILLRADEVIE